MGSARSQPPTNPHSRTSPRRPAPTFRRTAPRWPRSPVCSAPGSSSPPAPPAGCDWPRSQAAAPSLRTPPRNRRPPPGLGRRSLRPAQRWRLAIPRRSPRRSSSTWTRDPTTTRRSAPTRLIDKRLPRYTVRQPSCPRIAQRRASALIPDRYTSGRSLSPADRSRNPLLRIPLPDNWRLRCTASNDSATEQAVLLLGVFLVGQNSFITELGEVA